ncbi:MAG: gliding motility-associated C-terminal domain-containing protein [Saprospiraceae bacterium]|nr:gliding motility-associated C-terminal domain-containing protein [Saprospiraceae bacterium]
MRRLFFLLMLWILSLAVSAQPNCASNSCCCGAPVNVGLPNGNFEMPLAPSNWFTAFYAGESFNGWNVLSGSIDLLGANNTVFNSGNPNGPTQFIDLNGYSPGTMATTLTGLAPNSKYTLVMWTAKNAAAPSANCTVLVAGGAWLNTTFTATNSGNQPWIERCFTFTTLATTAELRLIGSSNVANAGVLLDDITLWKCPADNTPPNLTQPAQHDTVNCSKNATDALAYWLSTQGSAAVSTPCGPVVWTNNFSGDSTASTIEVTFTATDRCNNSVSTTAFFVKTNLADTTYLASASCNAAQTGVFIQNLNNQYGCDSTVIKTVSLLPSDTLYLFTQSCDPALVGVFSQTFNNQYGCDSTVISQTTLTSLPVLSLSTSDYSGFGVSCFGLADGSLAASATGAAPFQLQWSNGVAAMQQAGLPAGVYTVTASDANGCTNTASVSISAPEPLVLSPHLRLECSGDSPGSILAVASGGLAPYQFAVDGLPFQSDSLLKNLQPGPHQLRMRDANGCEKTETLVFPSAQPIQVDLGPDRTVELGETLTLDALINIPGDSLAGVLWLLPDSLFCASCLSQTVVPVESGIYSVQVRSLYGCTATAALHVFVRKVRNIYVPNAFSPDNDGRNDLLYIFAKTTAVRRVKQFAVFDRWGAALLRHSNLQPNDPNFGWDGTFRGQAMPPGVYAWYAEIEFADGETQVFSGDVLLVR